MGTDLTTTGNQQLTTLPGAQALRRIERLASIADGNPEQARGLVRSDMAAVCDAARDQARSWLVPATKGDAKRFLAPTLALVAPSGMSADDQTAWLAAAMDTLSGIPADLLARGCREARLKVDHPARIVPAINAEVGADWRRRKDALAAVSRVEALLAAPTPEPADIVDPAEAARIIDECGLRITANGNRPVVERVQGKPRAPTAAEIAALAADFARPNDRADDVPVADITGLSLEQISEQAARLKAERIARQLDQRRSAHTSGSTLADEFDAMDRHAA